MHTSGARPPSVEPAPSQLTSIGLILTLLGAGVALNAVAGPPRVPAAVPAPDAISSLLGGSELPPQLLVSVAVDLAWLVWLWAVGSMLVEVLVLAAELVGHGARWATYLRRVADHVTLPLARRAVAAVLAVQLVTRAVPVAAAAPLSSAETSLLIGPERYAASAARGDTPAGQAAAADAGSIYVVEPGDTLWSIAQTAYGSGTEYRRIVDANLGRRMPDGRRFTATGVIRPGWQLRLPRGSRRIETDTGGHRWYTVEPGDTLSSIATQVLDDPSRWSDLFALNRGAADGERAGQRVLVDPDLIWPGLRLRLPDDDATPPSQAPTAEAGSEPPTIEADQPALIPPPLDERPLLQTATSSVAAAIPAADLDAPPQVDPLPPLELAASPPPPIAIDQQDLAPPAASTGTGTTTTTNPSMPIASPTSLAAVGLAGLAGAAVLGRRRLRRLRPLPQQAESEVLVEGGYAEAQLTHDFARSLQGGSFDPLAAIAAQVAAFLAEHGLADASLIAVRHGRSSTTLTLAVGLAEQNLLLDLAPTFGSRLEADVEAYISPDQDVVWRLSRVRKTRLLPAAEAAQIAAPFLVPLGVLYDRQVLAGAWPALGHVLVASLPGHGCETILTSLVATLAAHRSPAQLQLWYLAEPRALPAALNDVPHRTTCVDATDPHALALAVDRFRSELDHRATAGADGDLVLVIPELLHLGEHATSLALVAQRAQALGVRLIVGTSDPIESAHSPLLPQLATRMVLHMQDEDTSVALLGVADAAYLGGGGRLLLRLDGRQPVELYGYQVASDHLERLARVMRAAYPSSAATPTAPSAAPAPPLPPVSPAEPDPPLHQPEEPPPAPDMTGAAPQPSVDAPSPPLSAARPPATAPLHVICFGGPRVLCGVAQVWPARNIAETKAFELLIYLACQPPEGAAREAVGEALWPDNAPTEDDPGHRFRNLRYRLRKTLGGIPGAPDSDGIVLNHSTLRLDPGVVYSDVHEFLLLVRTARQTTGASAVPLLEQARALYQGDLLEGPDARRYAWMDERDGSGITPREYYRRLFVQATRWLADHHRQLGNLDMAVALYRELGTLDPADEYCWRALFQIHADRGDRPALVLEEHRLRECLRALADDDDELEPSRELMLEYQRTFDRLSEEERVQLRA